VLCDDSLHTIIVEHLFQVFCFSMAAFGIPKRGRGGSAGQPARPAQPPGRARGRWRSILHDAIDAVKAGQGRGSVEIEERMAFTSRA
jgi:hypothetical protein